MIKPKHDVKSTALLSFAEVANRIPWTVTASTVRRWAVDGVCGTRLGSVRVGGRRLVPLSALTSFLQSLNQDHDPEAAAALLDSEAASPS